MVDSRTCRHFNGLQNKACRAGVNIREMVGGSEFGWALRMPCTGNAGAEVVECPLLSRWTKGEAAAIEKLRRQAIAKFMDDLAAKLCPNCGKNYEGVKRGPCVYCEHCDSRLYQGSL